ncbi:MAG: alkaline phosphatase [Bdellovibrio bacteriovorus]
MDKALLSEIFTRPVEEVWPRLFGWAWSVFSEPIGAGVVDSVLGQRDRRIAPLDNLLSGSAWELWDAFEATAPRTVASLEAFWATRTGGKAILVLDALSLREVPWLLEQAQARGYTLHEARATASELPAETMPFARALGFGQRSALAHNGANSPRFPGATTEASDLPFAHCVALVPNQSAAVFWHEWPDDRMHHLAEDGAGFRTLAKEAAQQLTSDDFWGFVDRLATGRRLVITSDHGYAHVGLFPDVGDREQAQFLKTTFKSGRSVSADKVSFDQAHHWAPPLTRTLTTAHGNWHLVLGRQKWKSQGGYPTLAHGGLSLLEVAVPYLELSK